MTRKLKIQIPYDKLSAFCKKNHINKLSFFGSVLRDDFSKKSDIDILVEFDPHHIPGLDFFDMRNQLSKILKRKVDLNTPGFLSGFFRKKVQRESVPAYVKPR